MGGLLPGIGGNGKWGQLRTAHAAEVAPAADADVLGLLEVGLAGDVLLGILEIRLHRAHRQPDEVPDAVEALFNPGQYSSSPFLTIKSLAGKVAPGTYTITNVVPAAPPAAASGKVNNVAMTGIGSNLIAPGGSPALGLILGVSGAVASATITIDPGLGGALQSIRDALRARSGAFASAQERLDKEADRIAEDRDRLEVSSSKYYNQLLTTFTAMDNRVSAFKATQSYLDQQIKIWTNSKD